MTKFAFAFVPAAAPAPPPPPPQPPSTTANTISLRNKSAGAIANHPVQIGRAFVQGEVKGTPSLLGFASQQAVVKNRWPDGSVKFAVLSGIAQSIPVGTSPVAIGDIGSAPSGSCDISAMLSHDIVLTLTHPRSGATQSVNFKDMIAAGDYKVWLDGPVSKSIRVVNHTAKTWDIGFPMNGFDLKPLRPFADLTYWPSLGKIECLVGLENIDTEKMTDQVYGIQIGVDGNTVYSQAIVPHTVQSRWVRQFWIGGAPDSKVEVDHNFPYLCATKLFPNYDQRLAQYYTEQQIAAKYANFQKADYNIFGFGQWLFVMDMGGGSPQIGPTVGWALDYLYSFDNRMKEALVAQGSVAGSWPLHVREGSTGRYFDAAHTIPALGLPLSGNARPMAYLHIGDDKDEWLPRNPDGFTIRRGGIYPINAAGNVNTPGITCTIADDPSDATKSILTVSAIQGDGFIVPNYTRLGDHYLSVLSQLSGTIGGIGTYSISRPQYEPSNVQLQFYTTFNWQSNTTSHQPDPFSVLYMTTGGYYWLEQMQMWACQAAALFMPTTENYGKGVGPGTYGVITIDMIRTTAWAFRNRFLAYLFSPDDDPVKGYLDELLGEAIGYYLGHAGITGTKFDGTPAYTQGKNYAKLPRSTLYPMIFGSRWTPPVSVPLWQNSYLVTALGRMKEAGYSDVEPLFELAANAPIGIFNAPMDHAWLATVGLWITDTSVWANAATGAWCPDWASTLNTADPDFHNFVGADGLPDHSPNANNYASLANAASAYAASLPGGQALSDWVKANWLDPWLPLYGAFPNWAIVPR